MFVYLVPSAAGQPTRRTQPFILSGSISCNWMSALVASSGECLWGEGLVWLIGAMVCSLAAAGGPIVRSMRSVDGRISAAGPLALANQLPLPMIVKRGWSGFPVRRAI